MGVYGLQNKPLRSVVMSDSEIADLPGFARDIIAHQRSLERLCSAPVVALKDAKDQFETRKFLARSAHRLWVNVDGNGPRTAR